MDAQPPLPTPLPPAAPPPVSVAAPALTAQDVDQLRLLTIGHYVVAGLMAVFSLIFVIHIVMGLAIVTGAMPMEPAPGQVETTGFDPRNMGWIFVVMGCGIVFGGLTLAGFVLHAGRCLAQRRRHTLCLVVGGLCCLFTPVGTILGVFALVVLLRPQVKAAFGALPAQAAA